MNKDLNIAKKTVQSEILALKKLLSSFNKSSQFTRAVNLIYKTRGKIFVIGVGKSYIVGSKVSSTLSSLGTPSVAFNATDLLHGGLGCIDKNNDYYRYSANYCFKRWLFINKKPNPNRT